MTNAGIFRLLAKHPFLELVINIIMGGVRFLRR